MTLEFIDQDLPFHAHDVGEARWRQCPEAARLTWQALAQWGAALTHEARGHSDRAARVAAKALVTLAAAPSIPEPVDVERVRRSCRLLIP
jgi:predicted metal-dependent hydrolase